MATRQNALALKTAALSAAAATLLAGLLVWMLLVVAEQPGVPRELGDLPPWFGGEQLPPRLRADLAAAAQAPKAAEAQQGAQAVAREEFVQVDGTTIEIVLTEYEMKPRHIRARPGAVRFVLRNEGRFAHNFHVEGQGVDTTAEKFSPGRTVSLELSLREGEYKISCPLSNHDQRGMHGLLVLAAKAS